MRRALSLLLLPLVTVLVFGLGLTGGFAFDDYANFLDDPAVAIDELSADNLLGAIEGGDAGPLGRPLSRMSFALNHALSGRQPFAYKATNLLIHVLCAAAVYLLGRVLLRTPALRVYTGRTGIDAHPLALLVAGVWAVSPINLTPVLYIVQRMTSLSSLFVFLALACFVHYRSRLREEGRGAAPLLLGTGTLAVLGLSAKESAAVIPALCLVCEYLLIRGPRAEDRGLKLANALILATFVLPALALAGFLFVHPEWLARQYAIRDFTILDRLLTEARVLWLYVKMIVIPIPSDFGLYLDDIPISRGLLEPPRTLLAVIAWLLAVTVAWRLRGRHALLGLAVFWFLGAHWLESSFIALEPAFEHRNYVASFAMIFALVLAVLAAAQRFRARPARLVLSGWILLVALTSVLRSEHWSDPLTLALAQANAHPASYRSRYELGRLYHTMHKLQPEEHILDAAQSHFSAAARLDPTNPLPVLAQIQTAYLAGEQPLPQWRSELARRLRDYPPHPKVVSGLRALVRCQASGPCDSPPQWMLRWFGAIVGNPGLRAEYRPHVLRALAAYYADVGRDWRSGADVMKEAVAMAPEVAGLRLNYANYLAYLGELELMEQHLQAAQRISRRSDTAAGQRRVRRQIDAIRAIAREQTGTGLPGGAD